MTFGELSDLIEQRIDKDSCTDIRNFKIQVHNINDRQFSEVEVVQIDHETRTIMLSEVQS